MVRRFIAKLCGYPAAELPIPLYKVLKAESKLLSEEAPAGNDLPENNENWLIIDKEIDDWSELFLRRDVLELEKLHAEVAGAQRYWYSNIVEIAVREDASKKEADPQKYYKNLADDSEKRKDLLEKLNFLVRAPKALYNYRSFRKNKLSNPFKNLTEIDVDTAKPGESETDKKQREDRLPLLNRLLLEALFPTQIRKAYNRQLGRVYAERHKKKLSALCLSGGGIRSATFALGILQGLQRRGQLETFDYLSTVSGGGYIGGWLSAWMHHEDNNTAKVYHDLISLKPDSPTAPEPKEVQHLRAYSNYLTPKLGLLSADTWTLIATYLRNLSINWLVFIPALLVVCALPRLCVSVLRMAPKLWEMHALLWTGLIAATWSVAYASLAHPGATQQPGDLRLKTGTRLREFIRFEGQLNFLCFCLLPLFLSAALLTTFWIFYHRDFAGKNTFISILLHWHEGNGPQWRNYLVLGTAVHLIGWCIGRIWLSARFRTFIWRPLPFVEIFTGAMGGALLFAAAKLTYEHLPADSAVSCFWVLYPCFAIPVFLMVFLSAGTLFDALRSRQSTDEDREWWVRMGAWILIALIGWMLFSACILLGPLPFFWAKGIGAWITSLAGTLSGIFTLVVAHSGKTAATNNAATKEGKTGGVLSILLGVAGPIFVVCLVAGLSLLTSHLFYFVVKERPETGAFFHALIGYNDFKDISPGNQTGYLTILQNAHVTLVGRFILAMVALTLCASFINLNKYTLHAVYRNRLVRAYLGASNPRRKPNMFTGFDPEDNVPMSEIRSEPPSGKKRTQKPLHIVNMALNLVGGDNLAWQQRKAETFTASKLHCGNLRLGYRKTEDYAVIKRKGLKLGTAVAISGAAANSNMGYHSSPIICFLMTLFNVRLGCWLGNPGLPGQYAFREAVPEFPAYYAAKEALGMTNDNSRFVLLSDGGHFENLGIYEMVLRRCKLIVVSDAGSDLNCSLEDLGNAIRKVRIDLGVNIELKSFDIYSRNDPRYQNFNVPEIGKYCAIGTIDYNSVDGVTTADGKKSIADGVLIYLKPAICGTEPKDVFNYKESNKTFPHESTADQFFSESQFESYRALGLRVIERIYECGLVGEHGFSDWATAYAASTTTPAPAGAPN